MSAPAGPGESGGGWNTSRSSMRESGFSSKVAALKPVNAVRFASEHALPLSKVFSMAGVSRQTPYNWEKGHEPSLRNWQAFQSALLCAYHDKHLQPRRAALAKHPDLAWQFRWLLERAVEHGDLSERTAAEALGLDFEAWNVLPPLEAP